MYVMHNPYAIGNVCTEIEWTSKVYDIEACAMWREQVIQEQLRVRDLLSVMS